MDVLKVDVVDVVDAIVYVGSGGYYRDTQRVVRDIRKGSLGSRMVRERWWPTRLFHDDILTSPHIHSGVVRMCAFISGC